MYTIRPGSWGIVWTTLDVFECWVFARFWRPQLRFPLEYLVIYRVLVTFTSESSLQKPNKSKHNQSWGLQNLANTTDSNKIQSVAHHQARELGHSLKHFGFVGICGYLQDCPALRFGSLWNIWLFTGFSLLHKQIPMEKQTHPKETWAEGSPCIYPIK